jgi:formate dehydrogenase major subunit
MVKDILEENFYKNTLNGWYLTTGRILAHYNNAAQTKRSKKLISKYDEDIILAPISAKNIISSRVILKSKYGQSEALKVKFVDTIKNKTLFTTFHHAKSKINALFGDECDSEVMTARFKSIKVDIINIEDIVACS